VRLGVACLACLLVLAAPRGVHAQSQTALPLQGAVSDYAGVIDTSTRAQIADLSTRLHDATGDWLAVATVKTVAPFADARSYAVKMFENGGRGLGEAKSDNGILILLAVQERQVRIEVGYALEEYVTDGFAGETSRDVMVPYFKQGDYGGGLLAGAQTIAARLAEKRGVKIPGVAAPASGDHRGAGFVLPIWLIILVIFLIARNSRRRPRGPWGGGPWSGWSSGIGGFGGGFGGGYGGGGSSGGGFGGGFGGFGGGSSGGGGGGASW